MSYTLDTVRLDLPSRFDNKHTLGSVTVDGIMPVQPGDMVNLPDMHGGSLLRILTVLHTGEGLDAQTSMIVEWA